jgi:4-aminobutyrate aminotransferase
MEMKPPRNAEHLAPVWARYFDLVVDYAQGCYVWDIEGRRYTDFTCGIGVTNTGHCHPGVVAAAQEQVAKCIHVQANIYYHKPMLSLVDALLPIMPGGLDTFFFSNSGAEAVEASIKLARQYTGRPNIIVFDGGFHGRTVATMSLTTSKAVYRTGYAPLMAGVHVAPFPFAYRQRMSEDEATARALAGVNHLFKSQTPPEDTAAMLVEPVLGEGGYVPAPDSYLRGLREICDRHGILLIVDEIQTGFGRTGKMFGCEHSGVRPDIVVLAKGLASGFPLSGIAATRALMAKWKPGSHGGTYGGNAVACAAAVATIRAIRDEGMVQNSATLGERLMAELRDMSTQYPLLGDVRGLGLMVGCEFSTPEGEPDPAATKAIQKACMQEGLLLLTCGTYDNVIRWVPPLNVTWQQISEGLGIFASALHAAAEGSAHMAKAR